MSEPIIEYRGELNVMDFASRYAERVSRVIDEQTLANVEHQLAGYGYVKVVRCRDCEHLNIVGKCPCGFWAMEDLDGFCAWGVRKESIKEKHG